MENKEELIKIIDFILEKDISYEELKEKWEKVYVEKGSPFEYVEITKYGLYFEFNPEEHSKANFDYSESGCGTIKIE